MQVSSLHIHILLPIFHYNNPSQFLNSLETTTSLSPPCQSQRIGRPRRGFIITMRDRSKNRKPLQKGRTLSIEAIQTVQAIKRAKKDEKLLAQVMNLKFRRLLKFDMAAVLRDLIRQNECQLALKVFKDVRQEHWYKPQLFLYTDFVEALARNGMHEEVVLLFSILKTESGLQPDAEGFNGLLRTLVSFNFTTVAMDCFHLMRALDCDPEKPTMKILIDYLESEGETGLASIVKEEALKIFWSLEFLKEEEDIVVT